MQIKIVIFRLNNGVSVSLLDRIDRTEEATINLVKYLN